MIGKVLRGAAAGRLLYYLYGPGRANEHTDPHLVAGFGDPAELEPERRPGGAPDLRRLTRLLNQPLAALRQPGYEKPVWHCSVRAAPEDRLLSDIEWARIAALVMDRTGLARSGDEAGVRWVAVRHGPEHVHIVATLARLDGTRPGIWNDFYRVREACQAVEEEFGLIRTAPADRTAARRPGRAETEQAARRGWAESARDTLRREVCAAAAAAGTEREFFARLAAAGVAVRQRHSQADPELVTGYAVGLPGHLSRDGGIVWYGGAKLAADLTLPKLRRRWETPAADRSGQPGAALPAAAARAVLREIAAGAAARADDEAGFLLDLERAGVLLRLRHSDIVPGQVTGYAVALPGHLAGGAATVWFGGGKLAPDLSLPRLRRYWNAPRNTAPERPGTVGLTAAERSALGASAENAAAAASEWIRRAAHGDRDGADDAARAVADMLTIAARACADPGLRLAADAFDRAARSRYGMVAGPSRTGSQLRAAARLLTFRTGPRGYPVLITTTLINRLADLAIAVAELRQAQDRLAQARAARSAAHQLRAAGAPDRPPTQARRQAPVTRPGRRPRTIHAPGSSRFDFLGNALASETAISQTAQPTPQHQPRRRPAQRSARL